MDHAAAMHAWVCHMTDAALAAYRPARPARPTPLRASAGLPPCRPATTTILAEWLAASEAAVGVAAASAGTPLPWLQVAMCGTDPVRQQRWRDVTDDRVRLGSWGRLAVLQRVREAGLPDWDAAALAVAFGVDPHVAADRLGTDPSEVARFLEVVAVADERAAVIAADAVAVPATLLVTATDPSPLGARVQATLRELQAYTHRLAARGDVVVATCRFPAHVAAVAHADELQVRQVDPLSDAQVATLLELTASGYRPDDAERAARALAD